MVTLTPDLLENVLNFKNSRARPDIAREFSSFLSKATKERLNKCSDIVKTGNLTLVKKAFLNGNNCTAPDFMYAINHGGLDIAEFIIENYNIKVDIIPIINMYFTPNELHRDPKYLSIINKAILLDKFDTTVPGINSIINWYCVFLLYHKQYKFYNLIYNKMKGYITIETLYRSSALLPILELAEAMEKADRVNPMSKSVYDFSLIPTVAAGILVRMVAAKYLTDRQKHALALAKTKTLKVRLPKKVKKVRLPKKVKKVKKAKTSKKSGNPKASKKVKSKKVLLSSKNTS